ncbi:protein kinase [Thermodesulfobacteriota bacterium]
MSKKTKKIGDYELVEPLGKGGFGTVWKARSMQDSMVALKVLHPKALEDQKVVNKFFHEAIIMAKLDHPHIAKLLDFFSHGDNYAIVMEFIEGYALKQILDRQRQSMPFETAFKIARQSLDAFQYALDNGILHRDIKPANIMIDNNDNCKIMDFGIAKLYSTASHGTASSMLSFDYIPPERYDPKCEIDARSDIYSIGLVFYEMFAGQKAFMVNEIDKIMFYHMNMIPEPPSAHTKDLPAELSQAIMTSLEKDPKDRFKDFREFKKAIESISACTFPVTWTDSETEKIAEDDDHTIVKEIADQKIGAYEIVAPVGTGSLGDVWKTKDSNGHIVAIKVFDTKLSPEDTAIEACYEQAKRLFVFDHPHISKFLEFFADRNKYAVAVEYVEGTPLKKLLPRQKDLLPLELAVRIAQQLLDALQYAYENKFLHQHIKPRNIMIDKNGDCKILDFGIPQLFSTLTGETDRQRLSLHYTAPERYELTGVADVRSDVYSVGLILYEMFAGRRVFMVSETEQIMSCHLNILPEPPSHFVKDLPPAIENAIIKALEKEPEDRFHDFQGFKEAIDSDRVPHAPARLKKAALKKTVPKKEVRTDTEEISGQKIGGHQIISPLGVGSFGSVWKAKNADGNIVALKVLIPKVSGDDRLIRRYFNKAMVLAQLNHPNIMKLLEFFTEGDKYAVAMEYVEGTELRKLLSRPQDLLPFDLALRIARQMLAALQYAYRNKLLDLYIKPRNIMIDKNGDCKIMDFGITELFSIISGETEIQRLSLHYTSPERYDPQRIADVRSDIYSIGLIFYEMFAGRRAFMVSQPDEIIASHLNLIPEAPSQYAPELPLEISHAILKALEKEPEDRFQDFREFSRALASG